MLGGTVNVTPLLATPPTVTTTGPVVAPVGTGATMLVVLQLLGVAAVLTQLWFPYRYWSYANGLDGTISWIVLARDLVLVALVATLLWSDRQAQRVDPVRAPG